MFEARRVLQQKVDLVHTLMVVCTHNSQGVYTPPQLLRSKNRHTGPTSTKFS
eukprot:SAG31_NODE_37255_length_306_cov_0.497585_1_plen_51_part_01